MTRTTKTVIPTVTVAMLLMMGGFAWAAGGGPPEQESADVLTFADVEVVEGATARLTRDDDALMTRTDTRELDHHHAMTLWWVIFNHPDECEYGEKGAACGLGDVMAAVAAPTDAQVGCVYGSGSIVGGNGYARFTDRLPVGEVRDSCIDHFAQEFELEGIDHGLTNPEGAEVHLVVRSHGPLIPGQVAEQRSTFAGGCTAFLGPGEEGLKPGECSDLQFAVFPASDK
jgi:hypothetical protein